MKIIVDKLPKKCEDCQFCADAIMMSPLGVQKEVQLCTVINSLIPQSPQEPFTILDKTKTPEENNCLFIEKGKEKKIELI